MNRKINWRVGWDICDMGGVGGEHAHEIKTISLMDDEYYDNMMRELTYISHRYAQMANKYVNRSGTYSHCVNIIYKLITAYLHSEDVTISYLTIDTKRQLTKQEFLELAIIVCPEEMI